MFPGPVFVHELRTAARRVRFYALRFVFGLFLSYMVWAYAVPYQYYRGPGDTVGSSHRELARIGGRLFGGVVWLQAMAILLLTPALAAGAIGEDRERKILSYLLCSPLSAAEIVLGKLAARLVNLAVVVMVGLPVVSLVLFLGGVDPVSVWLCFAATMTSLFFLACMSVFVSTYTSRPRDAILLTYFCEGCWLFSPSIEFGLSRLPVVGEWIIAARPVTEYLTGSSPLFAVIDDFSRRNSVLLENALWMIGLQLVYGTLLAAWCTLRLRAVEQGSELLGLSSSGHGRSSAGRRLRSRRPCGDDPMLWKECAEALSTGSRGRAVGSVFVAAAFLTGVGYWFYEYATPAIIEVKANGYGFTSPSYARNVLNEGVRLFTMVLYPLLVLYLAIMAAASFTSEREKDTWISLIATPLEGWEIVRGKLLGSIWRVRWIAAAIFMVWSIGLFCGALHPLGFLLVSLSTTIYAFAFASLGTYISIRATSSTRAIATTLGIGMFCNVGYLFCCIPMMMHESSNFLLAGFTPIVVVGGACTFDELAAFLSMGPHGSTVGDFVVLGVLSLAFYGVAGFVLLFQCLDRFQIEVDRPRKERWPRVEAGDGGIHLDPAAPPDPEGITYVDDDIEGPPTVPEATESEGD